MDLQSSVLSIGLRCLHVMDLFLTCSYLDPLYSSSLLLLGTVLAVGGTPAGRNFLCDALLKFHIHAYGVHAFLQICSICCVCCSNLDILLLCACPDVDSRRLEGVGCLWMCIKD